MPKHEWIKTSLGEVVDLLTGFPFKSAEFSDDPTNPRLLRGDNVVQGAFRWEGAKYWPRDRVDGLAAYSLREGDVILAMDRPWIEAGLKRAMVRDSDLPALLVQRVSRLRAADDEVLDQGFLRYIIDDPAFTDYILAVQTGTSVPHISGAQIRDYEFDLPPLPEQRAIARVLGGLDDKIELNRRMNRTLEDLARGLFRSWFVDFDPVTKSPKGLAGHASGPPTVAPAGAAAAGSIGSAAGVTGSAAGMIRSAAGVIASASPGGGAPLAPTPPPPARTPPPQVQTPWPTRLVDSPLGPIPEGWRVGTVADLCTTQYGYTASATDDAVGPRMLRVTDMNKEPWVEWADVPHCRIDDDLLPRYALKLGDVLVSRMADPGKAAIVEEVLPEGAVFASYLIRLATRSIAASYYLFYYLRSDQYLDYAESVSGGTVQKNMNAQVITAAQMVIAPDAIADEFARIVRPWRAQIAANLQQSRHLAALRDALLPQLLSGEIRLREAERAVEDALQSTSPPPRASGNTSPRGGKAAGIMKGRA